MVKYYLSKEPRESDGKYVIHNIFCTKESYKNASMDLGSYPDCIEPYKLANKLHPGNIDGCRLCCFECHERAF